MAVNSSATACLRTLSSLLTPLPAPPPPPQVSIPTWALVHLPVAVTLSTAWFTRKVRRGHRGQGVMLRMLTTIWRPCLLPPACPACFCCLHQLQGSNWLLSSAPPMPQGWVYSILYVLFENAMGTVKLWAVVTGARRQGDGLGGVGRARGQSSRFTLSLPARTS